MAELGSGNGSDYPGSLDTDATQESSTTTVRADVPNDLAAAIVAIEKELGIDPAGTKTDVVSFLTAEHDTDGTHGTVTVSGSLTVTGATTLNGAVTLGDASGDAITVTGTPTISAVTRVNNNVGINTASFGTGSPDSTLAIAIGTRPTSQIAGQIAIHARDSSDGATNATLALETEQAVEGIGTFTASHKLKIWINETEYWVQLDAV
jgi:hypothetical protein